MLRNAERIFWLPERWLSGELGTWTSQGACKMGLWRVDSWRFPYVYSASVDSAKPRLKTFRTNYVQTFIFKACYVSHNTIQLTAVWKDYWTGRLANGNPAGRCVRAIVLYSRAVCDRKFPTPVEVPKSIIYFCLLSQSFLCEFTHTCLSRRVFGGQKGSLQVTLLFFHVGSGDWTQVSRLDGKRLYPRATSLAHYYFFPKTHS